MSIEILGSELAPEAFDLINQKIATVVIATLDEDWALHTEPFQTRVHLLNNS